MFVMILDSLWILLTLQAIPLKIHKIKASCSINKSSLKHFHAEKAQTPTIGTVLNLPPAPRNQNYHPKTEQ
jgi:hypothetical protein